MTTNHGPDAGGPSRLLRERRALGSGHTRKLLLTSAGIRNEVLRSALADLVEKPFGRATVAFVPTAALAAPGDHGWLIENVNRLYGLGWREFSVVELNGLAGRLSSGGCGAPMSSTPREGITTTSPAASSRTASPRRWRPSSSRRSTSASAPAR
jgi:hypothetical protein